MENNKDKFKIIDCTRIETEEAPEEETEALSNDNSAKVYIVFTRMERKYHVMPSAQTWVRHNIKNWCHMEDGDMVILMTTDSEDAAMDFIDTKLSDCPLDVFIDEIDLDQCKFNTKSNNSIGVMDIISSFIPSELYNGLQLASELTND